MKLTSRRLAAFFLLIALSVGFGFGFDALATAIEKGKYARPAAYRNLISEAAEQAGIPEAVVYSVIRTESGFDSGGPDKNGRIGLFRLTPERFREIYTEILHEDAPNEGMLYDPATNLRAGCAALSDFYRRYGMWEPVYAAWRAGSDTVDAWVLNPEYLNKQGKLAKIPDNAVAKFVSVAVKGQKMYTKLYFQG